MTLAAGIDIGGTSVKLGLVSADGHIVEAAKVPTSPGGEPTALLEAVSAALAPMLARADAEARLVSGIGVSVAGLLDPARERVAYNANLPLLADFPLRQAIAKRFGLPCRLEVDSNAAAVGEYRFGAGRGSARLLAVILGTGVGGGVVVEGELLRFFGECAGDLGHVIVAPGGRACTCGAAGCLEAMVCAAAISERVGGRPVEALIQAAGAGEPEALAAFAETGKWLGLGLASLSPLFAPDRIVIGGGIANAGAALLEPTRKSYLAHGSPHFSANVAVLGAELRGHEGLVGAASMFLEDGAEAALRTPDLVANGRPL